MTADNIIELPEEISIANIGEWKEQLSELLVQSSPITINASELSRVDTSAIQLFTAFVMEVGANGNQVIWSGISDNFKMASQRLGVEHIIFANNP